MYKTQLMVLGVLPECRVELIHATRMRSNSKVLGSQALVSTNTLANTDCKRKLFATHGTCAHTPAFHYNYPSAKLPALIVQPDGGMYATHYLWCLAVFSL